VGELTQVRSSSSFVPCGRYTTCSRKKAGFYGKIISVLSSKYINFDKRKYHTPIFLVSIHIVIVNILLSHWKEVNSAKATSGF
jgi:hypothetical protein